MQVMVTVNDIMKSKPCQRREQDIKNALGRRRNPYKPFALHKLAYTGTFGDYSLSDALWCIRAVKGFEGELIMFALVCNTMRTEKYTGPDPVKFQIDTNNIALQASEESIKLLRSMEYDVQRKGLMQTFYDFCHGFLSINKYCGRVDGECQLYINFNQGGDRLLAGSDKGELGWLGLALL